MEELEVLRAELISAHTELDKIREYTESLEARINFLIKEEVGTYESGTGNDNL